MSERQSVWSEALSKAQAVKVRNVMNPLLWLNAVAMPLLLMAAYIFQDKSVLAAPLIGASVILPIWTMIEYRYFARKDPKRLQSEEYLLEHQRLQIQSKRSTYVVDALSLPAGSNPEIIPVSDTIDPNDAALIEGNHLQEREGGDGKQ